MFKSLWTFRHFIMSSIRADMRNRFARSRLGAMWFILHPLAQALIFSIVLAEVLGARLEGVEIEAAYPIYLLSGLAAWTLFSEILTRSVGIFIEQASVLKKITFPRLSLPIIVWGSAMVNHLLLLAAILVIFAVMFGQYPNAAWLAIPLGMALISMLAFGLGVFLGVLNVFSRDVAQVMTVVVQLWFWITPIVYPRSIVPEGYQAIIDLNPMVPLVTIYQDAMLYGAWPDPRALIVPATIGVVAVALSFVVFRRASADLVDAL
ncbi:ABC transporter permease [Aliihoeflea sp. 40Bstr573]|uniref:ABC transporter permease n=1 Tax=Aliihoeflea sp. 40Bstr573 TaxID=2696467 RepID=UPI002095C47B|nr:ABC transporter permease [Aliihoeflea sp. 40Bstr573]MCO6387508.1 ABC transporter permease [Aliihoeflea sp. 40Bstr573]